MKFFPIIFSFFSLFIFSCTSSSETTMLEREKVEKPVDEIFYHVVQRSFYDSDGDRHGDLKGLETKLDYLQDLGVTSILLLPLYESDYYHNYFPNDFEEIDPRFGSKEDYLDLVKAVHSRDMKIYMDMEIHYVTEKHIWFSDSYQNPTSQYSSYITYNGPENTEPESIIFNLDSLEGYDGKKLAIATLNLKEPAVLNYMKDLFSYWVDPNADGNFEDGVDGFRIDHMMDDLDWKGKYTGLLKDFWNPIFTEIKAVNPNLKIIAEQANWTDYGDRYFSEAKVDMTFAFGVKDAIVAMDKQKIMDKYDSTFMNVPIGKSQLIFLENHDTDRFASEVEGDKNKLKMGAAMNFLLKGTPVVYYGQEIGMTGTGGFGMFGQTDGNDIPRREAFEWFDTKEHKGHALWYKETGPWWEQTNLKDNDGISVEEQIDHPLSLFNFYRGLIYLREDNEVIQSGNLDFIDNPNDQVLSFTRQKGEKRLLICMNLSNEKQAVDISLKRKSSNNRDLISSEDFTLNETSFSLNPWQIIVLDW